ncbi:MAG: hypothetical protein LBC96_00145 [Lachnospiraceae bacterium]|nr:hypothetical protein [Lachnospiraceae bacterium]
MAGITKCADCGLSLVEELPQKRNEETSEKEEEAVLVELLKRVSAGEEFSAAEGMEEETLAKLKEDAAREMAARMRNQAAKVYKDSSVAADEHRSSAYSLLLVGTIGLVVVLMFFFDFFPFQMTGFPKYLMSGVMSGMFALFVVMGVLSIRKSKTLTVKAGEDRDMTDRVKAWCLANVTAEQVDFAVMSKEEIASFSEEVKFFRRADKLGEIIDGEFGELEEGYQEFLVEEVYSLLFSDESDI